MHVVYMADVMGVTDPTLLPADTETDLNPALLGIRSDLHSPEGERTCKAAPQTGTARSERVGKNTGDALWRSGVLSCGAVPDMGRNGVVNRVR
jgi:hypothetical protein